jgi:hypothetical protein
MGSSLGQYVEFGKGSVWLLPSTSDNAITAAQFASTISAGLHAKIGSTAVSENKTWDIFISHASEDKPFTDRLHEELKKSGVRVWYDKSVLVMGDSLRKKIDEGLAGSRFGVVVLSQAFFSKQWPQANWTRYSTCR